MKDQPAGHLPPPRHQPGYYPSFSTLDQQAAWDEATRRVILNRVSNIPPIRFFDDAEARLLACVIEHVLPQDDRLPSRRIPILPFVDERLFHHRTPGYRYEEMPPDGEAYRLGLRAIEEMAAQAFQCSFLKLTFGDADRLLKSIHDGEPLGGREIWRKLPIHRFWAMLMHDCVEVYFAHPWAWDEIGFGGPAYPRGYFRLERGEPEPWEKSERRYDWSSPQDAVSDLDQNTPSERPSHGQSGSH